MYFDWLGGEGLYEFWNKVKIIDVVLVWLWNLYNYFII